MHQPQYTAAGCQNQQCDAAHAQPRGASAERIDFAGGLGAKNCSRRTVDVRLDLVEGTYKLDVAIHKLDGYPYDYHRLLYTFRVKSRTKDVGIYRPRHAWQFSDSVAFERPEPS